MPPLNQSFSMPAEEPTPHANVSSQVPKDKSAYSDIEELKQHMKEYVSNEINFLMLIHKYKTECVIFFNRLTVNLSIL